MLHPFRRAAWAAVFFLVTACAGQPAVQTVTRSSSAPSILSAASSAQASAQDVRALVALFSDNVRLSFLGTGLFVGRDGLVMTDESVAYGPTGTPIVRLRSAVLDESTGLRHCDSLLQLVTIDTDLHAALYKSIAPLAPDCALRDDFVTAWDTYFPIDLDGTPDAVSTMLVLRGFSQTGGTLMLRSFSGAAVTHIEHTGRIPALIEIGLPALPQFSLGGMFGDGGQFIGFPVRSQASSGSALRLDVLTPLTIRTWIQSISKRQDIRNLKDQPPLPKGVPEDGA